MTYKLIVVSAMIIAVLLLTYLKDGEKMDPPLKRRTIIDTTTIALLWSAYALYWFAPEHGALDNEVNFLLAAAMTFFVGRIIQLINAINPVFKDFTEYIKNKKHGDDTHE